MLLVVMKANGQWIELETQNVNGLKSISAVNDNLVWALPISSKVLKSTNGGTNWISYSFNSSEIPSGSVFNNIFAIDESTAFISGRNSSYTFASSYRTTNGGLNWVQVYSKTNGYINAIWMKNLNEGILTDDPINNIWTIYKTTNGGNNWFISTTFPALNSETGRENSIYSTENSIWIPTGNGRIFYSSNFGLSWNIQNLNNNHEIGAINFINTSTGICAGNTILSYTTNSGTNWIPMSYPNTYTSVGVAGGLNDFIIGNYGRRVYRTTNLGNNWLMEFELESGVTREHMIKSRTGGIVWDARTNGKVGKRTILININSISSEIPSSFSLSQNYPNPFNPETKIKISIPLWRGDGGRNSDGVGIVRLTVYDALGREIETLVNEALQPGTYEVTFNGSRYNSGVYFYRLVTDGFTETKRMLLIK